jgi:predicted ATPase
MIEETGERYHEAEAHRLSGALLLSLPTTETGAAESAFRKAIEVARSQQAKWTNHVESAHGCTLPSHGARHHRCFGA